MPDDLMTAGTALEWLARQPEMQRPLESFEPWDHIPWEAQAGQLLRCPINQSFLGLRPAHQIDIEVAGLIERMRLQPGATVLDLGCGPGLHANRLGARGYRVTGIDIARDVLVHAQAQADAFGLSCSFRRMSLQDLDFDSAFEGVFLANSVFNQLTRTARMDLLRRVRGTLVPGGVFACEVLVAPDGGLAPAPEVRKLYTLPSSPWSDRPHHWLERLLTFAEAQQRVTHHLILDASRSLREHWSRSFLHDRHTLIRELEACGFVVMEWLDAALRGGATPACECVWFIAKTTEDAST